MVPGRIGDSPWVAGLAWAMANVLPTVSVCCQESAAKRNQIAAAIHTAPSNPRPTLLGDQPRPPPKQVCMDASQWAARTASRRLMSSHQPRLSPARSADSHCQ